MRVVGGINSPGTDRPFFDGFEIRAWLHRKGPAACTQSGAPATGHLIQVPPVDTSGFPGSGRDAQRPAGIKSRRFVFGNETWRDRRGRPVTRPVRLLTARFTGRVRAPEPISSSNPAF
jgi:hypothetical protein